MSDRDYCYPPVYIVLRNRLDIRDAAALEAAERELVALRFPGPVPAGDFDLDHLRAIHRRIVAPVVAECKFIHDLHHTHARWGYSVSWYCRHDDPMLLIRRRLVRFLQFASRCNRAAKARWSLGGTKIAIKEAICDEPSPNAFGFRVSELA